MKAVKKRLQASRAITPACSMEIRKDRETTQIEIGQARGDKIDHATRKASPMSFLSGLCA
jgi:hypothetical protein